MFRSQFIFGFATICLIIFSQCVSAQDQDSVTEEAKALFDDVRESRSLLTSGKFRAKGKATFTKPERSNPIILPAKIEGMFDHENNLLRMEFESKVLVNLINANDISSIAAIKINRNPKQITPKTCAGFLLKNQNYSTSWYGIGIEATPGSATTHMYLYPPNESKGVHWLHYFDPAAVGLLDPRKFTSRHVRDLQQIVKEYLDELPVVSLEKGEKGLVTIVCQNEKIRRSITIDTQKGYTISRMTLQELDSDGNPRPLPLIETTGDWKKKDSIWLPSHFKAEMKVRKGWANRYEYDIEWIAINPVFNAQEVESLFTYRSFPELVWKNIQVFDYRSDANGMKPKRPKHIDTIGAPFRQIKFADE